VSRGAHVYKRSSESPDPDERIEYKLDDLLEERGIDPNEIEQQLPAKHRSTVGSLGVATLRCFRAASAR
jgi:hypothetical protein